MVRLAVIATMAALAGCCKPQLIRVPVQVETVRPVVEPIPAELLRLHPAEDVPASELHRCPEIARQRLDELRACNDDKRALRAR